MHTLQFLLPQQPFIIPGLSAILIYGLRYLLLAGIAFALVRPGQAGGIGRPHACVPAAFNAAQHVRRELIYSFFTVLIFSLVIAVLYGYGLIQFSLLYFKLSEYPMWWFWLSIPLMLLLHDTFFYWLHRLMHTPQLFKRMHRVHHQSVYPTAFAAYSFHPYEALGEALIVTVIVYILPVHALAFLIFQSVSTAYNVYGHCGREFYPASQPAHWLGRWLNTSTLHAHHHLRARNNYGLYFTFWDRLMGTLESAAASRKAR